MPLSMSRPAAVVAGIALLQLAFLLVFFDFFMGGLARDAAAAAPGNAWLFALLIAAGYVRYTLRVVPGVRQRALEFSSIKLWALPLAVMAGIIEEVAFRAALMDYAAAAGWAVGWQILASALAFGLAHSIWVWFARDWSILRPVLVSTSVLGACLAVLYLSGGRNVWPCVVAHVLINLVIEPWLLIAAVDGSWREAADPEAPPNS